MNAHRDTEPLRPAIRSSRVTRWAAVAAAGALALTTTLVAVDSTAASASTLNGVATVANPSTQAPLASGASTTPFTVTLPANAACSGDTASGGYHVYSYLVKKGTKVSSVTFVDFPSTGYGFVDNTGLYYGPANTAIGTGQIISIPNDLQWAPLVTADSVPLGTLLYTSGTSGVWEAGLVCANTSGAVTDNWNTEITFHSSTGDPHGFTWAAVPGVPALHVTTTSLPAGVRGTPYSTTLTASGGTPPYKWKKVGTLPKGLKLSSTGVLSGTVSTKVAAGHYTINVTVSDAGKKTAKETATASFTLTLS